jgi:hypothetical protein
VFTFFLETGCGEKTERALKAIAAMENLGRVPRPVRGRRQRHRQPVGRGEAVPEGHDDVPGLRSYLASRGVRPNLVARDSSRLILVQVSLPMIASSESLPVIDEWAGGRT